MLQTRLYDADRPDGGMDIEDLPGCRPGPRQLLWVDLHSPTADELARVREALCLAPQSLERSFRGGPAVRLFNSHFRIDAVPVASSQALDFQGSMLCIVAGDNCVVTLHDEPMACLEELRAVADAGQDVGLLSADSFVAAMLDWQLSTYFGAVAEFERQVESLEVRILDGRGRDCLDELRRLRRAASRLRRMLAPHRVVFGALSRPDFRPSESGQAERHYQSLDTRFERAMDMVEHARELVIGSFELFSSQTGLQTNRAMSRLTFVTVVLGLLAVAAGMMGMNSDTAFFASRDAGFWATVSVMAVIALVAIVLARRRDWI